MFIKNLCFTHISLAAFTFYYERLLSHALMSVLIVSLCSSHASTAVIIAVQTVSASCPTLGRFASGTSEVGVISLAIWWYFPHFRAFWVCVWGGGGGRKVRRFIPQPALFIFKVEINSHTPVPHFRPGSVHSGLASWDDRVELRVSRFPRRVPKLRLDSIVIPLRLCWVKGVGVFRCNLPPVPMAEWPESFTCHCANTGWNGHRISVSTES